MKTAFVRHLIVCAAALVLADAWADTWTDPDTGYTWTYRITKEDSAEIYNNNSCAISPSPTGALIIPSSLDGKPVTSIGAYALYECNRLTSVAIPDSVTGVGRYAFTGCTNLEEVVFNEGLEKIGDGAFANCKRLSGAICLRRLHESHRGGFARFIAHN